MTDEYYAPDNIKKEIEDSILKLSIILQNTSELANQYAETVSGLARDILSTVVILTKLKNAQRISQSDYEFLCAHCLYQDKSVDMIIENLQRVEVPNTYNDGNKIQLSSIHCPMLIFNHNREKTSAQGQAPSCAKKRQRHTPS